MLPVVRNQPDDPAIVVGQADLVVARDDRDSAWRAEEVTYRPLHRLAQASHLLGVGPVATAPAEAAAAPSKPAAAAAEAATAPAETTAGVQSTAATLLPAIEPAARIVTQFLVQHPDPVDTVLLRFASFCRPQHADQADREHRRPSPPSHHAILHVNAHCHGPLRHRVYFDSARQPTPIIY